LVRRGPNLAIADLAAVFRMQFGGDSGCQHANRCIGIPQRTLQHRAQSGLYSGRLRAMPRVSDRDPLRSHPSRGGYKKHLETNVAVEQGDVHTLTRSGAEKSVVRLSMWPSRRSLSSCRQWERRVAATNAPNGPRRPTRRPSARPRSIVQWLQCHSSGN
jgi:hypothetical protein